MAVHLEFRYNEASREKDLQSFSIQLHLILGQPCCYNLNQSWSGMLTILIFWRESLCSLPLLLHSLQWFLENDELSLLWVDP